MRKRLSLEVVKKKFIEHNCELITNNYISVNHHLDFKCKCGRIGRKSFTNFLKFPCCSICGRKLGNQKKTNSQEKIISFLNSINYKMVSPYITGHTPMTLICDKGHTTAMTYSNLRKGWRCRFCKHERCFGASNHNWNPNLTNEEREKMKYRPHLREVRNWRKAIFIRDDFTCIKCQKKGGYLNAHHLNSYHWDKENRFNVKNGVTLCKKCHAQFHWVHSKKNNTVEQFCNWFSSNQRLECQSLSV